MQDRRSDHVNSFTRGCRKLSWGENFHGWHFSTGVSSSRRSVSRLWDDAVPLSLSLSSLPPPRSLLPLRRIIPYSPCLLGAGHTDASLHFALALLLQVQSPHCYNGWPLLALLPVLLLLSLLLPVAADRRMEKRRASCFVECRIRGKLHSLWPAFLSLFLFFTMSLQRLVVISFFLSYILDFTPFLSSKFRMVDRYRIRTKDA